MKSARRHSATPVVFASGFRAWLRRGWLRRQVLDYRDVPHVCRSEVRRAQFSLLARAAAGSL